MGKTLITTVPFGQNNRLPLDLLDSQDVDYSLNPINRKLTEDELISLVSDVEVLIAGTEPITRKVINAAPKLKFISRVGIGLDSVDLIAARDNGIQVAYTPDAPAPAVAELTIGLMLSLLRGIHLSNYQIHSGEWARIMGRRIPEITIGIIGTGRIGSRVLRRLSSFGTPRILVNDLNPDPKLVPELRLEWVDKETIYKEADLISLHLPLTRSTRHMIREVELRSMKPDAIIINTSRGGIVVEDDLDKVLNSNHLSGAAVDVFEVEPYIGHLARNPKCLLTAHMGSMSIDCRNRMEIEATQEVVRWLNKNPLEGLVPESEYLLQQSD